MALLEGKHGFPNMPMTQDGHFVGIAATCLWTADASTVLMSNTFHKCRVVCALVGFSDVPISARIPRVCQTCAFPVLSKFPWCRQAVFAQEGTYVTSEKNEFAAQNRKSKFAAQRRSPGAAFLRSKFRLQFQFRFAQHQAEFRITRCISRYVRDGSLQQNVGGNDARAPSTTSSEQVVCITAKSTVEQEDD
jgi:hypothetical protein